MSTVIYQNNLKETDIDQLLINISEIPKKKKCVD